MTEKNKTLSLIELATKLISEKVSTGGGATGATSGPEPVAAAGGGAHANRPQDKLQADPMVKPQNPAGTPIEVTDTKNNTSVTRPDNAAANRASVAMKAVAEDVAAMFAGQDVSEEFKTKATTIFEAAVAARVAAAKEELTVESAQAIAEAVKLVEADLTTKIDEYLSYVTEQWLEANALQLESGLRADISESFMKGLYQLFTEHHVQIPEDQIDAAAALAERVSELEEALNSAVNEGIELKKVVDAAERAKVIAVVTEGLVETQKEKLKTLFEGVEFTTAEEFKTKLTTIKEGYTSQGAPKTKAAGVQNLLEQVEEQPEGPAAAPILEKQVRSYVDAISRTTAR